MNINSISPKSKVNFLQMAVGGYTNPEDRIKIIKYLIKKNIDINYTGGREKMNALHILLSDFHNEDMKLKSTITKILVENGIDINARDSHDGTALVYLVCNNSIKTEEAKELIVYLIKKGADYKRIDKYENTLMDYAINMQKTEFIEIVKELENDK